MKQITFTNLMEPKLERKPVPASKEIPEWYKELESYPGGKKITNGEGATSGSIKKCMPVFDAITGGYIIYTPVDIFVSQRDGAPYYEWPSLDAIQFHPIEQAPTHPAMNGFTYPKFINPWGIKTPNGYSTLFMQPVHRESVFTILPGIVDTDGYTAPVNFPFVLNDTKFEGLIPEGTPMAQVIPFKRESWKMALGSDIESMQAQKVIVNKMTKIFDSYKNKYWNRKEFK